MQSFSVRNWYLGGVLVIMLVGIHHCEGVVMSHWAEAASSFAMMLPLPPLVR